MLPKFLLGSYKRYKADTETFTTWLAITAEECGHVDDDASSTASKSLSKYKVPLRNISIWAEAIRKAKKIVPSHVIAAGQRCIQLRQKCSNWFRSKAGNAAKAEGDEGHTHFIQVLQQALLVLLSTDDDDVKNGEESNGASEQSLSNLVAALQLEDFETDGGTEPTPSTTGQSTISKPVYDIDDDEIDKLQQKLLQLFCLFNDLQNMRNFLQQTWEEYKLNIIDIMAAAVTTNTAIDLVREQVDELKQTYADIDQFDKGGSQHIWIYFSVLSGREMGYKVQPDDPFDLDLIDIAEWSLFSVYQLLDAFTRVADPNSGVPLYNGQFGWWDPKADWKSMSARDKLKDDRAFLMQHLTEFAYLAAIPLPVPITDEVMRGLVEMCRTQAVPIWLAFATQVYLDIKNILRPKLDGGYEELKVTGNQLKSIISDHFQFHSSWPTQKPQFWAPENNKIVKDVRRDIAQFVQKDWFISAMAGQLHKEHGRKVKTIDHALYSSHPLLCSVLTFNLNLRMQELGIILVNAWGTGLNSAHFYNVVQTDAGAAKAPWYDIEQLIHIHDEERVYCDPPPEDLEEAFERFCSTDGMDKDTFAVGGGVPNPSKTNHQSSGLEERTVISKIYRDRYCQRGELDLTTTHLSTVLSDIVNKTKKYAQSKASRELRTKFDKTQKLSPLQLLAALQERLVLEERALKFNYFSFNNRSLDLYKRVRAAVNEQMLTKFPAECYSDDRQVSYIVYLIMLYAYRGRVAARQMGATDVPGTTSTSKCVVNAGNALKGWIRTNGDLATRELNEWCVDKLKSTVEPESWKEMSGC